jgi:hypothetical protein
VRGTEKTAVAENRAPKQTSQTMIVKNEEPNLRCCLESVRSLFDEIIIVDTGSTDRSGPTSFAASLRESTAISLAAFGGPRRRARRAGPARARGAR